MEIVEARVAEAQYYPLDDLLLVPLDLTPEEFLAQAVKAVTPHLPPED